MSGVDDPASVGFEPGEIEFERPKPRPEGQLDEPVLPRRQQPENKPGPEPARDTHPEPPPRPPEEDKHA